jgi:hypothetical protein
VNDALGAARERRMLEPFPSIVICTKQTMARDIFEVGYLSQSTLKLFKG